MTGRVVIIGQVGVKAGTAKLLGWPAVQLAQKFDRARQVAQQDIRIVVADGTNKSSLALPCIGASLNVGLNVCYESIKSRILAICLQLSRLR